tara:strand:- start:257 stop:601 length:345 start_codon:yes stop_codon:yes gene_type:complete
MMTTYILDGHTPVKCEDTLKWGKWFESANRVVKKDTAKVTLNGHNVGEIRVSTVFLGVDYNLSDIGEPLLFETMVFGGELDQHCDRCSTWEAAEKMHELWIEKVKLSAKDEANG